MRRTVLNFVMTGLLLAIPPAFSCSAQSQQQQTPQDQPPKPPPATPPSTQDQKQPTAKPSSQPQSTTSTTATDSTYDPFHAEQDVDVGTYYMHKGDVDAAIPRFEDAIRLRANFAKPRLLLAACYEKKHEPATALKYYKEYLKVYPDAPDRKSIEKKIEKLSNR
jgi:tetratricopeptide (TPR) repeat protein